MEHEPSFAKAKTSIGRSVKCLEFDFNLNNFNEIIIDNEKEFIPILSGKGKNDLITISCLAKMYRIDKSNVRKSALRIGLKPKKIYRKETGFQAENAYNKEDIKILSEYMKSRGHYVD